MTVGACVERARGEVEVRAVGINLRFGFIGSYVVHLWVGLRLLRIRWGLLAEIASDFFARSVTEKGHGGNVSFSVVTVDNVAVVLQNRALDAPKLGVEVEATALEDIQLVFSSVIHYSLRMTAPWRITSFFLFFYAESFVPTERKKCVNT